MFRVHEGIIVPLLSAESARGAGFRAGSRLAALCILHTLASFIAPPSAFAGTPQAVQGAPAQATPVRVEFEEAVRRAVERNPTIASVQTAVARAEALLQQSRASVLPTVGVGVNNLTLNSERSSGGIVTQRQNQTTFGATASVPILAFAPRAAIRQAQDQIDIAERSVTDARQQIAVAAAQAYLAVIALRRQVDVDTRALDAARAHLDYAEKRLAGGAGSRLNQLRAAQEVSVDAFRLENSRLAYARSQEALGVLLVQEGPVEAGGEPAFDTSVVADESVWMAARPDVQLQTAIRRAADRALADSRNDWRPSAAASFGPAFVAPTSIVQPRGSWQLAVSFSQPVFDGGSRRAVRALRTVNVRQASLALDSIQIQARSDARISQSAIASYERALTSARLSAEQAAEVVRIATAAFEVGATTNLEVIDAQRSARDAEVTATQAEDAVRRAKLDLLVALGRFPR
jgi:outer membrane protein